MFYFLISFILWAIFFPPFLPRNPVLQTFETFSGKSDTEAGGGTNWRHRTRLHCTDLRRRLRCCMEPQIMKDHFWRRDFSSCKNLISTEASTIHQQHFYTTFTLLSTALITYLVSTMDQITAWYMKGSKSSISAVFPQLRGAISVVQLLFFSSSLFPTHSLNL